MNKYITFLFIYYINTVLYKKNNIIISKNNKLHNEKKSIVSSHSSRNNGKSETPIKCSSDSLPHIG